MTIDPSAEQRLSQAIAEALNDFVAPLRAEIEHLRAQLSKQVGTDGAASPEHSGGLVTPAGHESPKRRVARGATQEMSCQVPKCEAPVLAKELCETHYRIMRRLASAGREFDPKSQRPCSARATTRLCAEQGCSEAHYAKGLCRRHYMAARARVRNSARGGAQLERADWAVEVMETEEDETETVDEHEEDEAPTTAAARSAIQDMSPADLAELEEARSEARLAMLQPSNDSSVAMPTYEMVARVVAQYRGGLSKVAEVLGRNRRNLMELLEKLNLMEHVVKVRASERKRVLSSPLRDRLADLLFREKLLEDLGCLKEVDEAAREEIQARTAQLAKSSESLEDVLQQLGVDCGLEEAGLKRLVWRYDLRRQLRHLKSNTQPMSRSRI